MCKAALSFSSLAAGMEIVRLTASWPRACPNASLRKMNTSRAKQGHDLVLGRDLTLRVAARASIVLLSLLPQASTVFVPISRGRLSRLPWHPDLSSLCADLSNTVAIEHVKQL